MVHRALAQVSDVRIDDISQNRRLSSLGLGLSPDEARELRDTLEALLAGEPGRHEHVSSSDYQTELTIWLCDDGEADT